MSYSPLDSLLFVCFSATGDNCGVIEEKIKVLEKDLLHDLKLMKHRQVIHPVLQEGS